MECSSFQSDDVERGVFSLALPFASCELLHSDGNGFPRFPVSPLFPYLIILNIYLDK